MQKSGNRGSRAGRLDIIVLITTWLCAAAQAWPQAGIRVVPEHTTYNVGSVVRLRVVASGEKRGQVPLDLVGRLRYAGEGEAILDQIPLAAGFSTSGPERSTEYREFWKIPLEARTGRYEVDVAGSESASHRVLFQSSGFASFAVHRKLVRIGRIQLDKTFYTSDDPVGAKVTLLNLTEQPLHGLRVEFSVRYWPWIAQSSNRAGVDFVPLAEALSLPAGGEKEIQAAKAAVAALVKQPAVSQYAVVVWDGERKSVYDIAFSPLVFICPPGIDLPKPYAAPPGYPLQYLHPRLVDVEVNVSSYRRFYASRLDSPGIEFDRTHTMFATGRRGEVAFSVVNPTGKAWNKVSVHVRVVNPEGGELASETTADAVDLVPGASPLKMHTTFSLPAQAGLYRVEVEVSNSSRQSLALGSLELGVNPLPKSILIFCAHEDDEGAHSGTIRAAVENRIPIHFVYFTSGDAGSCDRYYQRSCGPAESLNFGALRMEEARAAVGHLGVPRENIDFIGLPDGGSGQIWYDHVLSSNPYLSVMLGSDRAPYEGLARPNLPYARNSVVEVVKEFVKKLQPEVIYTGHPDERHVDHRTNNWFVVKALQELFREGSLSPDVQLLVDQSYGPGPQAHAPFHYRKHVLHVSGEAMAVAQEASWFYQSQDGNQAEARRRTFDQLPRTETHWQVLDWKDHKGWNEGR